MNTNEAVGLLWLVKAMWPNFEVFGPEMLPIQVGAWVDVLDDVPLPDARAALASLATTGREFAPTPGHVRLEARRLRDHDPIPGPDVALAEVMDAIRHVGYIGLPVWSHPAIGEAVAAVGGWQETCASENPEAYRAHFMRVYAAAAERHQRAGARPTLVTELAEGVATMLALEPSEDNDKDGTNG